MNVPDRRPLRVAILSIGDELVLGTALDTNSRTVSIAVRDLGHDPVEHRTVADRIGPIVAAYRELAAHADVVISTGGLGPTDDDLVRDALNAIIDDGAPMVEDPVAVGDVEAWFAGRGRPMAAINRRQMMRPCSARIMRNPNGTAPGVACTIGAARVYAMPGPPREMVPMLEAHVLPELRAPGAPALVRIGCATFGIGESQLAERLGHRMARDREPSVGTTASGSVVSIHVVTRGPDAAARAERELAECAALAAPWAFGPLESTVAEATVRTLRESGATLAVAESCTGGLVGAMLTAVPGASDVFPGGWIAYANAMKERELGVPGATIAAEGAVSADVALAMARGAAVGAGARIGVALTGIAGPGGGTDAKPVGTVWIAVHDAATGAGRARRFEYPGPRETVRDRAAKTALQLVRWHLRGEDAPVIWERT